MFEDKKIRISTVLVLMLLALFLLVKASGEYKAMKFIGTMPTSPSIISVSGEGEEFAIPDTAVFSFSVTSEKASVSAAQAESAKSINAIIDFLKGKGIEDKNIKTIDYSAYPRYEYVSEKGVRISPPVGKRTLMGFEVRQTIRVKTKNLEEAGNLLSGIGELGATDISGLSFEVEDEDVVTAKARESAIKDAKAKAEKLAEDLGVDIVRIVSFNENGGNYPYYAEKTAFSTMGYGGGSSDAASLPQGENKFTKTVNITYEIK